MANILTHDLQSNFLSGVLDPRVQGRVDTNAYVSSMLQGTNVELNYLGGVTRRRGSVYCQQLPNKLTQLSGTYSMSAEGATYYWSPYGNGVYQDNNTGILASIVTNIGGVPTTATTALGSNKWGIFLTATTTEASTINPYVIATCDLGSAQTVQFADVTCLSLTGGSTADAVIQYSTDNSTWTTLLTMPQVDDGNGTAGYAYRAVGPITARYWRVAIIGGANLGTALAQIGDFTLWAESSTVSAGRAIPFEVSIGEQYALILTDRSGTVVAADGGVLLQNIPMPYASADLAIVDAQASAETLALTHASYQTTFVIRQNSPLVTPTTSPNYAAYYNFQPFPVIFDKIPQLYFADSSSPTPTSDIQSLVFSSGWNNGDSFTITLSNASGQDTTGPIIYAGDDYTAGGAGFAGATSQAIESAVQALWLVNGFTGVTCVAGASAYHYTLTFAEAAAAPIGQISITSLSSNSTASATETQVGVTAQENLWSPVRGYAGRVTFFQGRLYFAGFQSEPQALVGSWVNNVLNFDTAQGLDDQAIFVTMEGTELCSINALYPGKSLCVFTAGAEFRFVNDQNEPITPTSAPQLQTEYGGSQVRPVMLDGAILFVQRNLKSVRDFQFDYTSDQYNSLGISALAPNLIYNVQDMAAWKGSIDEDLNMLFICNGTNTSTDFDALPNGTCAIFNSRKETSVQAWTVWDTGEDQNGNAGYYQNACTVVQNILMLVQRTLDGTTSLFLEQPTLGTYTDCGYFNDTSATGLTQITGLSRFNGVTVRVVADGIVLDNQVISGGVCPLTYGGGQFTYTVANWVEVGLNFNPTVEPMPLQTVRWPAGSNLLHKKRIVKARLKLRETQGLYMNGNVLQQTVMDQTNMDEAAPLYTGPINLEESTNWDQDEDKTLVFTQVDPLPMQILILDAMLSGEQ